MKILPAQNIVMIGAGKVASTLGKLLKDKNYNVLQVYSRTLSNASKLAKQLNSQPVSNIQKIDRNADIYIVAVKDDAIAPLSKKLRSLKGLIVHTSGTIDASVLKNSSKKYGVLYPLQTFNGKEDIAPNSFPILIEGNNKNTEKSISQLANKISNTVLKVDSDKRKQIHLAAVFACNFTNHMYKIASDVLEKNKISFDILKPLLERSLENAFKYSPAKSQTGPAIRGDKKTMKAHLKLLKEKKQYLDIYKTISSSIKKNS